MISRDNKKTHLVVRLLIKVEWGECSGELKTRGWRIQIAKDVKEKSLLKCKMGGK